MNTPDRVDPTVLRQRLLERREELERLDRLGAADRAPVELDQSRVGRLSRMDALQQQAMSEETGRRRRAGLVRIAAALERIESGDYGWCTACGEAIPPGRLELDPATPVCIDCAGS